MKKAFLLLSALMIMVACGEKKSDDKTITVTIEPLRYFVEQLAGDKVKVITLVPNGSSPETYEPTAQQMIGLSNSMMFVKVGNLGFERTWMEKIKRMSKNLAITDTSEGIATVESSTRGVTDQHTWMSCANALVAVKNIYNTLREVDPDNASFYKQRYETMVKKINALNKEITEKTAPLRGSTFIIYHPALTYFAKEYGLHQLAVEEDGREPSAASLAQVIEKAKAANVKLMLVQKEFDKRNAEIVAKALQLEMTTINPLAYQWDEEMRQIGEIIASQNAERQEGE
ncbi:MAG: metal ABC transporter solute-binding protein, Zn/Mn family [Prevotella sp.]